MKYKLTIIKYEKNENYEAEVAKYKEDFSFFPRGKFENSKDYEPRIESAERSLEVFLTEEEYKKVKEGVLTVFK